MTKVYDDALSTSTIYAAENNVTAMVERGGAVEFFGSTLDLRQCAVRTYTPDQLPLLQGMVTGLYGTYRYGVREQAPTIRISPRAYRRAWYSPGVHEIVLPGARWAWNDMVLCHEIAHAASGCGHDARSAHGKAWRAIYAAMVAEVVGPEAGLLLQAAFDL